jgi:hypothetical protein
VKYLLEIGKQCWEGETGKGEAPNHQTSTRNPGAKFFKNIFPMTVDIFGSSGCPTLSVWRYGC